MTHTSLKTLSVTQFHTECMYKDLFQSGGGAGVAAAPLNLEIYVVNHQITLFIRLQSPPPPKAGAPPVPLLYFIENLVNL